MNFYSIAHVASPEAQLSPCNIVTLQVRTGFKCWPLNLLALRPWESNVAFLSLILKMEITHTYFTELLSGLNEIPCLVQRLVRSKPLHDC